MVIRYIDTEKEFEIEVQGTKCTVKQVYPQGDIIKMELARKEWVETGDDEPLQSLINIMLSHVADISNLPEGWDIKKGLRLMAPESLVELSIILTNKSTFDEAEEKN